MIDFLKTYWDKLTGNDVMRSADITMGLEQKLASFESNAGEIMKQLTVLLTEFKDNKNYSNAAKEIGYNTNSAAKLMDVLDTEYNTIANALESIKKVAASELPKMMTVKTLTVKQSAIINLSEKINTLSMTFPSLILYILYKSSGDNKMIYKTGYKDVVALAGAYHYEVLILSKNSRTIFKDLPNLSDTLLSGSPLEVRHMASAADNKFPMADNKFVTTWIYNIGKWWVEGQIQQLEKAKEEKRLIELKLLELRERETTGNIPANISKQIEYYEDKLASLNRKVKEMSED